MAMTHLFDLLDKDPSINLELQIHGSLDSFRDLTSGHCQIAGLRIPFSPRSKEQLAQQYSKLASSNQVTLLKVASREQGILVKSGNPKNIISLEDLTRGSVRFINRQLNSGTRTTFDQLLARENIKAHQINDYESVEYGHKAVAAMIDSDVVDAGFGVEVSTETLKLNFVPILREVFVLVLADSLDEETRGRIGEHLGSLEFQQRINALAGYNAQGSGTLTDFDQLVAESKG
jgi:molybdate-binding protein